jgi:hypothetical protein
MKRNHLKIIITIVFIGICLILYIVRYNMTKNRIIDMTGSNDAWRASLNMAIGYNNELVIKLVTEEFEPPSEVFVDILVKNESVYNKKLEIEHDNFPHSGIYKCYFDSIKYLEKNYKDVSVFVNFNNEAITIPLTSIKIIE